MASFALSAQDLHLKYGDVAALAGVSLSLGPGECVAVVGESGSGKSTLLKCFNAMVTPQRGSVEVRDRDVAQVPREELRRSLGYVQQEGGLLPHWTVRQNVGLVPSLLGWERARIDGRVDELLAMVGLPIAEYGERRPDALSGGQRQRVAFARAMAANADILLLDEPFGALDPLIRRQMQDEFGRWREGKAVLLITHDLPEAIRLGDRVAVMRAGRIEQCDRPQELQTQPATDYVRALLAAQGVHR